MAFFNSGAIKKHPLIRRFPQDYREWLIFLDAWDDQIVSAAIEVTDYIACGQTAYDTGSGFYLEYNDGTPRFSFGDGGTNSITWDGATLSISGSITATTGTIGGWTINSTSLTDTAGVVGMSSAVTGGDDIRFFAGDVTPSSAEFQVTESGALTASNATITGAITASSGSFTGGITIGASGSLSVGKTSASDTTSGLWIGTDGASGYDLHIGDATSYVWWDDSTNTLTVDGTIQGTITAADLSGTVPLANQNIATQGWTLVDTGSPTTTVFSAVDADTVQWSGCTLTTADGTVYSSIASGNTGNMTQRTYIYFDSASPTVLSTTTTAATAIGSGKILVAVAEDSTDEAFYQTFGGFGGTLLTANEIAANAITANEIAASTITGDQINATFNLSTKTITADTGTIGGWTLSANDLSSGSFKINATNEEIEIGSATAPLTGTGIWIGKDGADYEFRAGDPANDYIHYDGSALHHEVQENSFTPTWGTNEFASGPSNNTMYYKLYGGYTEIYLKSLDITATAGSNQSMSFNNLPSAARPTSAKHGLAVVVGNQFGGTNLGIAYVTILGSGTVTFQSADTNATLWDFNNGHWPASTGTKALKAGFHMRYAMA